MTDRQKINELIGASNYKGLLQLAMENPKSIDTEDLYKIVLKESIQRGWLELTDCLLKGHPFSSLGNSLRLIDLWAIGASGKQTPCFRTLGLLLELGHTFIDTDLKTQCRNFISRSLSNIFYDDRIDTFKGMVKAGFDPVQTESIAKISIIGRCLSAFAANSNGLESKIALYLLDLGCSPKRLARDLEPVFVQAVLSEQTTLVAKLMAKGVQLSTLKHLAILIAEIESVDYDFLDTLFTGLNLNFISSSGHSPLTYSIDHWNAHYFSYLLDRGADIDFETSKGTALIYAVNTEQKEFVKILLERGANVNAEFEGNSVLDLSSNKPGFKLICKSLIKAGAKTSIELAGDDASGAIASSLQNCIQAGEVWANTARDQLNDLPDNEAIKWHALLKHCLDNNSTKPSKKWNKETVNLVANIGESLVRTALLEWFALVKESRVADIADVQEDYYDHYYGDASHVISENNTRLLKGLIWAAASFSDVEMSHSLRRLAVEMYKKVYGVGMRNAKLGNAAIYSLSVMNSDFGLKELIVLRASTKYNPALVNINRVFNKLAEAHGKTPDELAELATPDYGLTDVGEYRQIIGDFEAQLSIVSVGKCELKWLGKEKSQKSVPAAVKDTHAEEVKSLKALLKDVQIGTSAHSQRLESLYLRENCLDVKTWSELYINHKLVGFLARNLIWRVTKNRISKDIIYSEGGFITCDGLSVKISEGSEIALWHPSMAQAEEVRQWRDFLIEREVTQPFKQAHREIYILTDAERETVDHSLRFATHILKQSQFHALASQRGWKQQRGGSWDGGQENDARKTIPAHGVTIVFQAEGAESYGYSASGIYDCVATGRLTFYNHAPIALDSLDPLLFSEVMRDVDLFVGVASIANDPDWRDRQDNYWVDHSFGALNQSAETRKEVLTALIPKLKIADKLSIEGRFLLVKGNVRDYKIHLGSSNILMNPNDSYLCIVESRSKQGVMLPFEGDRTLSLILSKANLLANDNKIKDKTILSQIRSS